MLHSNMRGTVRYLTESSKGVVLLPKNEMDEKTGDSIIEVLEFKHPDARTPDLTLL